MRKVQKPLPPDPVSPEVQRYVRSLLSRLCKKYNIKDDLDLLYSDAQIALYRSHPRWVPSDIPYNAWVKKIVVRTVSTYLRRANAKKRRLSGSGILELQAGWSIDPPNPEELYANRRLVQIALSVFATSPGAKPRVYQTRGAKILLLRFLGFGNAEIALKLQVPVSQVESVWDYLKKIMKQKLEEAEGDSNG